MGTSALTVIFQSKFFSFPKGSNKLFRSRTISPTKIGWYSKLILPASIFERSKISSINCNKPFPLFWITSAYCTWSAVKFSSWFSAINLLSNKIEFKGVRNSCDIFAKNSDLYFVDCANSLARFSISWFFNTIKLFLSSNNLERSSNMVLVSINSSDCTFNSSSEVCKCCDCASSSALICSSSVCCVISSSDCVCVSSNKFWTFSRFSKLLIVTPILKAACSRKS